MYGSPKSKTNESNSGSRAKYTNEYYAGILTLRSMPAASYLNASISSPWVLPITSMNEDRVLKELGLSEVERSQVEGLSIRGKSLETSEGFGMTEEQISSRVIARVAANPPPEAGHLQRLTAKKLLRPFPLGLRFSGKNMNPLPFWLAGAQAVCLNVSNVDLPLKCLFALFKGTTGYVLKPSLMRAASPKVEGGALEAGHVEVGQAKSYDDFWPRPREILDCVNVEIFSLHNLPKRGERRPNYSGERSSCHEYHPELSGAAAPPDNLDPTLPHLTVSLHPIGGVCAVSKTLPFAENLETETDLESSFSGSGSGGLSTSCTFCETVYCVAAEPRATFLRISVTHEGREIAFETAVLGRLRRGYRIFQLRSPLGTRIELCYLFVRIKFTSEQNMWITPRQWRMQGAASVERQRSNSTRAIEEEVAKLLSEEKAKLQDEMKKVTRENDELKQQLSEMTSEVQVL